MAFSLNPEKKKESRLKFHLLARGSDVLIKISALYNNYIKQKNQSKGLKINCMDTQAHTQDFNSHQVS